VVHAASAVVQAGVGDQFSGAVENSGTAAHYSSMVIWLMHAYTIRTIQKLACAARFMQDSTLLHVPCMCPIRRDLFF